MQNKDPGNISEFSNGLTGACGPTAYEEARAALDGRKASNAQMANAAKVMNWAGWASPNGITTLADLGKMARSEKYQVITEWDYGDTHFKDTENWHQVLLNNAGKYPIILFLTNGQALKDVETGAHDEVGLHGHFICVLDKQTDGYKCTDGDNPQVGKRYCIYSYGVLINAQVNGILVLGPKGTGVVANKTYPGIGSGLTAELNALNLPDTYKVLLDERGGSAIPGRPDEIVVVVGDNTGDVVAVWNKKEGRVEPNWTGHILLSYIARVKELETQLAQLSNMKTPAPTPAVPAELHNAVAEALTLTQPYADINAVLHTIAKELGY